MGQTRRYYLGVVLSCYLLWAIVLNLTSWYTNGLPTINAVTNIDLMIVSVPEFVWVYMLGIFFPIAALFVVADPHRLNRGILSFLVSALLGFLVILMIPSEISRSDVGQTLSERLISVIRSMDSSAGSSLFPSIYVAAIWLTVMACWRQRLSTFGDILLIAGGLASTVSVLFIKQQVMLSVAFGMLLAFLTWWLVSFYYPAKTEESELAPAALIAVLRRSKNVIVAYLIFVAGIIAVIEFAVR